MNKTKLSKSFPLKTLNYFLFIITFIKVLPLNSQMKSTSLFESLEGGDCKKEGKNRGFG